MPKISSVAYSDGMPPRARIYSDLILEVLKEGHMSKVIKLNVIDRPKSDYTGGPSSLCPGCGHDQISES